ncbi:hypothetical protein F2Q69_00031602 [Brassica cretica]|uniref:Uncharacterized protein n=1 Tax=Brassica cretica TaxID=69181 RepID=A0A8S9RRK9_BRACR|nr:hypothetical protein F2Q69_00031602 [Brassica cretica]
MMETINGKYIRISITTPTTQAGTVGGGTQLPSQSRFNNVGNTERQSLYHCLFKLEEARACWDSGRRNAASVSVGVVKPASIKGATTI